MWTFCTKIRYKVIISDIIIFEIQDKTVLFNVCFQVWRQLLYEPDASIFCLNFFISDNH